MELTNKPNPDLARKLSVYAWIITAVVLLLVGLMRRVKLDVGVDFSFLPPFHATVNAITALVLLIAFYHIKRGDVQRHKRTIYVAIGLSVVFLLSYVLYHFTTPETLYCFDGGIRTLYFILLITHIFLAAVIFPFILFTFIRAYTNQFDKHRRMAKWVFPIWLYVAITGPMVYLMLRPCYG